MTTPTIHNIQVFTNTTHGRVLCKRQHRRTATMKEELRRRLQADPKAKKELLSTLRFIVAKAKAEEELAQSIAQAQASPAITPAVSCEQVKSMNLQPVEPLDLARYIIKLTEEGKTPPHLPINPVMRMRQVAAADNSMDNFSDAELAVRTHRARAPPGQPSPRGGAFAWLGPRAWWGCPHGWPAPTLTERASPPPKSLLHP